MKKERRSYTYLEAASTIDKWVKANKMTPTQFRVWLELRGITITRQYCAAIMYGSGAGPRFIEVFTEITGINVVKGLVEKFVATAR